ncbi:hypothetical protein Tco_1318087 [Tanacetum coccineum]
MAVTASAVGGAQDLKLAKYIATTAETVVADALCKEQWCRLNSLIQVNEILPFIRDLGHTGEIKVLSNVNVNHLHQPWRSFAAIINKCLSGKTTTLESLRLSRAQILWGMYHNKHIDYVYLLWEDFVFQVENKNSKKNNDMFYPCFTKVIVEYFMAKDPSILRRNKMFWHTARDDSMFTTIRSKAYKTYHAYATGEKTLKPKSIKKKADSESSLKMKPTQASKGKRIKTSAKGDKPAKKKQSATKSKGLTVLSEVALTEAEQMKISLERSKTQQHNSHASVLGKSSEEEDDDEVGLNDNDDDNDDDEDNNDDDDDADNQDDDDQEDDGQDDEDQDDVNEQTDLDNAEESDEEIQGANVEEEELDEEETNDEDEVNELYRDSSFVSSGFVSYMLNSSSDTELLMHTLSCEAVKIAIQLQSDRLKDEAQAENVDFINKLDDNIKKIIKDQVKEKVKAQVSKILLKIEKTVNEQLKAEVLTHSSNVSKISHVVAANLSELELKKILIDKMESNKCQDDEDKDEEPSAGSNQGSKRRKKGKEPESTGAPKEKSSKTTGKSTEGSKSHYKSAGKSALAEEPRHTTKYLEEPTHLEFKTGVTKDQPAEEISQLPNWFQKPAKSPTPDRDWNKTLPNDHGPIQPLLSSLA